MYCVTIEGIVNTVFKNEKIVLCRETAASYLGLSNGWGIPIRYYTESNETYNSSYMTGTTVENLDSLNTTEIDNILSTDEETTICELIIYECDYQAILESMSNYYYERNESFGKLLEKVKELNIQDKFNRYIEDAINYYNE